ncbi:hypothetical protein, partial [Helicobacter labetoulli]
MAIFNFDKLEQSNQTQRKNLGESEFKSQSIDFLRKNPTNIQWEQIDSLNLPKEQQYDYIKQNLKVEFDLDNATNKGLYGHRAEWDLNKKASEFKEKYTNKGFFNDVSKNIQGVVSTFGYESDDIKELIKDTDELALFVKRAGKDVENIPHYNEIKEYLNLGLNAKKNFFEVADDLVSDLTRPSKEVAKELGLKNDLHLSQAEKGLQDELKAFALYEEIRETQNQNKEVILTKEQEEIIENDLGFFSSLFRDKQEKQKMFMDIQRAREQTNNYVKLSKSLENVLKDEQFFGLLSNAETLSEKQQEKIKNFESVAEFLGFEAVAYNKNGLYFIKDERAYKVEQNFNQELLGVLNDNKGSFGLGIAGAMYGANKGASAKARFGNMVLYGAGGAFLGGALDSLLVDAKLNKDFDIAQALIHGSQEAGLNIAGDFVFKGVATTYKAIKGGMVKTDKGLGLLKEATNQVKLALSGQNMGAIDRALSKQAKKDEIPRILKSFQESQSDELIKKDFQNESLTEKILNKVSAYAPKVFKKTNEPSSLAQKRQELLSTALRNKDLADSLANQLDDVEARILSEASNKMAKDFKALSQSYENLIAKEILKDEANPSLPKAFQKAVELAEHNVKTQYAQSVAKLESTLKDKSIDLLTPFKNVADYAIREFGANAEISRALVSEVNNLQGRNITIKEALEKKDVNAIIRNYNDNPNALKKFRFQDNALELKDAIDTQIHNTIESGIAKGELDASARAVLEEFREANIAYADIKQRLNDKLTKAIFMNQPKKSTINSMRSVDEWKQAVLDKQWQDSIVGLENTIFAKFDPRMQEHTQTLLIFRSLERHIKEKDSSTFIDLSKALKDIEQLESLPLHPKAQNALNIFKELAQTYEFMQKLSGAKGFKSAAGSGALSTTLEGRMQVFMTNRLFKALFFRVPYIGDKDALLHHLKKAVQELKYPRAITLDMLNNPRLTSPNPKSPSNPNGEAYINESVAKDIQSYVSNPKTLSDELKHRAKNYALNNALTTPSDESILKAINDDTLIYTTIGNGKVSKEQVEKLREVVEKAPPKPDDLKVLQINADEAITKLHNTQGQTIPKEIDIQTFKNTLSQSVENQENFIVHLQKKQDAQSRLAYLNLVEPTLKEWDIKLTKGDRKELVKVFNDGDNFFTLLITEQDNKRLITFLPKARNEYIESKIKNADLIQTFTSRASESKAEWTRKADSTTNNLKWQQDGNVLRSVVELDNGEKLLLSKDMLENVYIQSNFKEQINSYDELMLQESLEKFAKDELENKLAKQIESKPLAQEVDSVILSGSEKSHSKKDTSAKPQYDKGEEQGYDKQKIDSSVKVEPINEFGENYPQFYHKPQEAIKHLLETKSGQVQGAFYRDEIGDITLAWGEKGTDKSDGWGLAKIVEYHPEVIDKLDELVQNLPIVKENANRYQLENDMYKLSIRKDFEGQKENWILTAFEKDESIARRRTDLPSSQSETEKTTSANAKDIIPQKRSKAGIAKLDSTQIQSQIQKEAKAQQAMADSAAQTQAKRDEIIALKEAKLGKNADEVPLDKGQDILYKPIRDTSIVLNDETAPFEAEFAVVKLSDIKPNFDNSNTQGRLIKQEGVIANIVNDFKPELIFYQEGGVNGVPIITRDGKVVSGNRRSQALRQIFNAQTHNAETAKQKYKQGAKEFLGVELENDEIIVRRLKENMSDKQILQLAFSSNIGRESTMGEKALSTLSLYRQNIATLPKALQSENVNELKSLVARHIDKQGNGLNTFEPNLALLTSLARNGKNSNILQSLDSIKGNSEYKNKIINMYIDNAGSFYNLAHNPSFKNLEFRDILSDAIFYTAKQNPTRELDYTHLINDIESFLNLAKDKQALKNALVLDSNKVENLTAQAFGVALAKFSRQENPSSALYECLKEVPKALELATQPTFFTQGKALSEVDIYDFLEYLINQGQVTQSQSALSSLMPKLRELRESIANPQSSVSKAESSLDDLFKSLKSKIDSLPKKQV